MTRNSKKSKTSRVGGTQGREEEVDVRIGIGTEVVGGEGVRVGLCGLGASYAQDKKKGGSCDLGAWPCDLGAFPSDLGAWP